MGGRERRSSRRRIVGAAALGLLAAVLPFGLIANAEPERGGVGLSAPGPISWIARDCGTCHVPDGLFSHPVDIPPSMAVPEHLPLVDGRLSCVTCHRAESATEHALARHTHSALLRGTLTGPAFCQQCHEPSDPGRSAMHSVALGRAHLRSPTTIVSFKGGSKASFNETSVLTSAECLACHDGSVAIAVQHAVPGQDWVGDRRRIGLLPSHPVSITYPDREGYVNRSNLDGRLRLHDGRVECSSCHSLYASEPDLLVVPNDRSTLCLSCHDK
jgi:predicted CXXCH cytochrome family protein